MVWDEAGLEKKGAIEVLMERRCCHMHASLDVLFVREITQHISLVAGLIPLRCFALTRCTVEKVLGIRMHE